MQEYARYRICKSFLNQRDHSQLSKPCGLKKEVDLFFWERFESKSLYFKRALINWILATIVTLI